MLGLFVWALMSWLVVGCGGGGSKSGGPSGEQQTTAEQTSVPSQTTRDGAAADVYVGRFTTAYRGAYRIGNEPGMIGLHVDKPSQNGTRTFMAFACDGLGPPTGKAGWFQGSMSGNTAPATSDGDNQTLEFSVDDEKAIGGYTDAEGLWHGFEAPLALAGAGIYDVSISRSKSRSEGLEFTGRSTNGATFNARDDNGDGEVRGVILANSSQEAFSVKSLALFEESRLQGQGLPTTYADYEGNINVPGNYVALVSPRGDYWLGRSGDIREGRPGNQLIALGPVGSGPTGGFANAFD